MSRVLQRDTGADLDRRLKALREALEFGSGRLPDTDLVLVRNVLERAGQRLGLGMELTVAALAGGTGSGKSSLFNTLAGEELSRVGTRRPTTGVAHACVWGNDSAGALLDWLAVSRRHHLKMLDSPYDGLVLLDLPDSDSTEETHRVEVDRLVELVDLLVWVLDPQKYADAVLHDRYLHPLASHAEVMVLVLNQVDRLEPGTRQSCIADLLRLAKVDGLGNVPVIATSTTTGEGLDELKAELVHRVNARRTASARLAADIDLAIERLAGRCDPRAQPKAVRGAQRAGLVDALGQAGGVEPIADAVAKAHLHRAVLVTGSPFTRWLRRLRPDPLKRLHLTQAGDDATRTSLPEPTPVQRAQVGTAIRRLCQAATAELPDPWPDVVLSRAAAEEDSLPDELDRSVAHADLGNPRAPRWWSAVGALQVALAATAVAGAVWLMILFFFDWLKFPAPPLPRVEKLPLPTLLLIGGLVAGYVVALVSRQLASVGGQRRKRAAQRRLREQIERLGDERIVEPVNEELAAYRSFCGALEEARGRRGGWFARS